MICDGEGPTPCPYLILGEAPGAEEAKQGRPFVGESGQRLMAALEAAGVTRDEVYITNAYKIRPPGNATPTEAQLLEHRGLLSAEFRLVQPERVLSLGNVALWALTYETGITRKRGVWRHTDWGIVLPTYHPAYTLYNQKEKETFFADVREFFEPTRPSWCRLSEVGSQAA